MEIERQKGATPAHPFPIYPDPVASLLAAHRRDDSGRDAVVAHVLGTCAGYAYADTETVATMMTRLGLEDNACVRIAQTVDAMFIFSTAYLVQSRCGRVVILCYRGTEPATLGNWLGDADVESGADVAGRRGAGCPCRIPPECPRHAAGGAGRVELALQGRSLLDPADRRRPSARSAVCDGPQPWRRDGRAVRADTRRDRVSTAPSRQIPGRLHVRTTDGRGRAVARAAHDIVGRKLFRHITTRDLMPALPPPRWGSSSHFGQEYRHANGEWRRSETPVAQLASMREIPRSLLAFFATAKRRDSSRYSMAIMARITICPRFDRADRVDRVRRSCDRRHSDRQHARPVPHPSAVPRGGLPLRIVGIDALRAGDQFLESRLERRADRLVLDDEQQFVLPVAGGDVEVGAADGADPAVRRS